MKNRVLVGFFLMIFFGLIIFMAFKAEASQERTLNFVVELSAREVISLLPIKERIKYEKMVSEKKFSWLEILEDISSDSFLNLRMRKVTEEALWNLQLLRKDSKEHLLSEIATINKEIIKKYKDDEGIRESEYLSCLGQYRENYYINDREIFLIPDEIDCGDAFR